MTVGSHVNHPDLANVSGQKEGVCVARTTPKDGTCQHACSTWSEDVARGSGGESIMNARSNLRIRASSSHPFVVVGPHAAAEGPWD
jgi:hypothetical protein